MKKKKYDLLMHIQNAICVFLFMISFSSSPIRVKVVEIGQIGKPSFEVLVESQPDLCKFENDILEAADKIRGDLPPNLTYLTFDCSHTSLLTEEITEVPKDGGYIRVNLVKDTNLVQVEKGVFGLCFFYSGCVIRLRNGDNMAHGPYSFHKLQRLSGLQIKLGEFWIDYNKENWDFTKKRLDPANYFKKKTTLIKLGMNNEEGEEILFQCSAQILGITLYQADSLVPYCRFPAHIMIAITEYLTEIGVLNI